MLSNQKQESNGKNGDSRQAASERGQISAPAISFLKGSGAMHGISEKFSPDLHTNGGKFTIPIVHTIGRKTTIGIPRYQ